VQEPVEGEYGPIAARLRLTFPLAPDPPFVLRSTTTMSFPVLVGALGVSGTSDIPDPCARTTNICVLDNAPFGFCICTLRFPGDCKSAALIEVMHCVRDEQFVDRGVPLTKIVDPGPGLAGAKLIPVTSSVNPPTVPAYALVGAKEKIAGPFPKITVANPDCDVSSVLVAITEISAGDGTVEGAVYNPVASMTPQLAGIPQADPEILQITC
jgi:hypothetical protein